MAVTAIPLSCDLVVQLENDKGTGSIARKYQNVKPSATDADIYDVANGLQGLAKLQNRTVNTVQRINTFELDNQ